MDEIDTLLDGERAQLVAVLAELDDAGWSTPSLCAGWRVRDVVVHLLMPYELTVPMMLTRLAGARFSFDRMADRWATRDTRSASQLLQALRDTAGAQFQVPGAPAEAPLSHLVSHAEDIYRPLGVRHVLDPRAATVVLDQLTSRHARKSIPDGLLDGLTFTASDTDWTHGTGPQVTGPATALIATLVGRSAVLDQLTGPGAVEVHRRLLRGPASAEPTPPA